MRSPALPILAAATLLATTAYGDVFLPEGEAGSVLHLADDLSEIGRIEGVENPHGLAVAPSRGILVIGSLAEAEADDMEAPEGVSEADHDAHHGGSGGTGVASIVTLVGMTDHAVAARIAVPGMVHHVEVDADERWAVVTHPGQGGVSLIDLDEESVRGPIATGPNPEYAVWSPDEEAFVVSNAGNATLSVVDPERGIVTRNLALDDGPKHLDRARDGMIAAALADVGAVALVAPDGAVERIEVGGELHGVQVARDAIWVAAKARDVVVRLDRATGERIEASPGPEPYHIALAADGLLVSSAAGSDLWRLDPDTLETVQRISAEATIHQIRVADPG